MSTSPIKLTVEELRARRVAEQKERERLRLEEAARLAEEDAQRDREFEAEIARVEAEKLEEERLRAEEEKKKMEAEAEKERLRVEDAKKKAKVRAIVTELVDGSPRRRELEREKSVVRLGKRKAVELDDDDDDEGSVVAEGSVR